MKFAFIIMGPFQPEKDHASIHDGDAQIIGVSTIEEACAAAKELKATDITCIELCGAFGESGAKKVIAATESKVPVGYVTHLPQQDPIFQAVFGEE